jgi:hypothetical protein
MFGSNILDIAIGMAFLFTLLSLIASGMSEFIESIAKHRARNLERGISEMLGADGQNFVQNLYNHGLINSLYRGSYDPSNKGTLPSYIPASNFALAVLDLVKHPPAGLAVPKNVSAALRTFEESEPKNLTQLQKSVEGWYNNSMERVAGWYKRRAQWIILGLGVVVAVVVNADAIRFATNLSKDTTLRQGIVAAAQAAAGQKMPAANSDESSALKEIKTDLSTLSGLNLPLGWADDGVKDAAPPSWWPDNRLLLILYVHGMGWLLTALAISLGAPFWFDLLKKIVGVRAAIKPQESKAAGST